MTKICFYILLTYSMVFSQIIPLRFLNEGSSTDEIEVGLKSNVIVAFKEDTFKK